MGWSMVRPGQHALSPFGADVPCLAMNSVPPMQSASTPALKVYPSVYRLRPSAFVRRVIGVGGLSAINGVAGCEHGVHIVGTLPTTQMKTKSLLHHTLGDGHFEAHSKATEHSQRTWLVPLFLRHRSKCPLTSRSLKMTRPGRQPC